MQNFPFTLTFLILILLVVGVLKLLVHLVLKGVGKKALAKQPDSIQLVPIELGSWKMAPAACALVKPALLLGFLETGSFEIKEMTGVKVHFLLLSGEAAYAAVYEHPVAGSWINFISKYHDGTSVTFTNQGRGAGLEQRPGHPIIYASGLDAASLYERFNMERPKNNLLQLNATQLARLFEAAYADSIAWRKNKGISVQEVMNVAEEGKQAIIPSDQPSVVVAGTLIYIVRRGRQEGPFMKEHVLAEIAGGRLTLDDLGWYEGLPDWVPLSSLLK